MNQQALRDAVTIGFDDLPVAEPIRPPAFGARLALRCGRRARLLGRVPRLDLDADRLVLSAPELLTEPLVVSRESVAVAIVDTREREGGTTLRFPYASEIEPADGGEAETYGWLYVRGSRAPLPLLGERDRLPNVVVVFTEPIPAPNCRGRNRDLREHRRWPGFFAHLCDPSAGRDALREWGVMRGLTVADAERIGLPAACVLR